ncbi:ABC transporter permease subunit [Streptomyces sp. NPDC008139]|uniref:ABC transporter permease n=1 Tax=Streptomyces sp. NPDC008139 TaxID=3364814 RepID=UPI0036E96117
MDSVLLIVRRVAGLVSVMLGIAVVTFVVTRMVPSDPAAQIAGLGASPRAIQQVRVHLGLDRPVLSQFWSYLDGLVHLDFGTSYVTNHSVLSDIGDRLPATLELAFVGVLFYVVIAVALGTWAAATRSRWQQDTIRIATLAGSSIPPYWLALVLQVVFYSFLGWLPPGGRLPVGTLPDARVTGFYLIDSAIALDSATFWNAAQCLALPAASLVLINVGSLTRLVRVQVLQERAADYVSVLRARGIGRRRIMARHVLPNAINPAVTVTGMQIGFLIGGTIYIEKIFQWPGLGSYAWDAIVAGDYPAVSAVAIVLSGVFVLITLVVDVLQYLLDPRARLARI